MNIAIHGEKELLIRLRDDLIKAGFYDDEEWNSKKIECGRFKYLVCYSEKLICLFRSIPSYQKPIHLTADNYTEILNKIIEKK